MQWIMYIYSRIAGAGVAVEKLRGGLVLRRWPCGGVDFRIGGLGVVASSTRAAWIGALYIASRLVALTEQSHHAPRGVTVSRFLFFSFLLEVSEHNAQ